MNIDINKLLRFILMKLMWILTCPIWIPAMFLLFVIVECMLAFDRSWTKLKRQYEQFL